MLLWQYHAHAYRFCAVIIYTTILYLVTGFVFAKQGTASSTNKANQYQKYKIVSHNINSVLCIKNIPPDKYRVATGVSNCALGNSVVYSIYSPPSSRP